MGLLTFATVGQAATIVFQDNFDSENGGVGTNDYSGFTSWSVVGGTVDLMGNGFNDLFPGNGLYVDLDGSSYIAGGLLSTSSFTLDPGITYTISFSLAANYFNDPTTKYVDVTIGSFTKTYSVSGNGGFVDFTDDFSVGSSTSATITFASSNVGGESTAYGALLDNVVLSSTPTGVPEPSSFLFMLAGVPLFSRRVRARLSARRS